MKIDVDKYIGKWFEIARIPTVFQLNMKNVTAEYIRDENNTSIKVINSGYVNGELKQITGLALPTEKDDLFKVSFFNGVNTVAVNSDYKILAIDEDYQYALVGGSTPNYLWILSRTPNITKDTYKALVNIAKKNGYNVKNLKITES